MNKFLKRLTDSAELESRLVIGLMSGTSLDGLDIALCRIKGSGFDTKVELLEFETFAYQDEFKDEIRSIFSKRQIDLEKLTLLNAEIGSVHAGLVLDALYKWNVSPKEVDFIASHGQTVYHAPRRLHGYAFYPNATLQIGDADHIAVRTGITTISDFRQKHVAAGGEGAPLALYGDCILFADPNENRVLLNIGGISNLTYLPASGSSKVICSDLGPGNTIIDNLCTKYFDKPYDEEGKIARGGEVNQSLLIELLYHSFFTDDFPKTTGPEMFNLDFLEKAVDELELDIDAIDLITTATQFTAQAVALGVKDVVGKEPFALYVSGGGAHNKYLIERIQEPLPQAEIRDMQSLGISADAKEAVLFAVLANETVCGSAIETGAGPKVMMGKMSFGE